MADDEDLCWMSIGLSRESVSAQTRRDKLSSGLFEEIVLLMILDHSMTFSLVVCQRCPPFDSSFVTLPADFHKNIPTSVVQV